MSDLIDAEDELNRLCDLLTLLSMAAGELPQGESRAMPHGGRGRGAAPGRDQGRINLWVLTGLEAVL